MANIMKGLIFLSGLAFVLAVLSSLFQFNIMMAGPESFSRTCSNLALIAIALAVCFEKGK